MKSLPLLLPLILLAGTAWPRHILAQTVRPAIVEYTNKASGSFEIVNDQIVPIVLSIEGQSFTIDADGKAVYTPLAKSIHLSLSTTSLKLPPKQTRTIYYQATADQLPAWFTIYTTMMGVPGQQGVSMRLRLPHTIYILPKTKAVKSDFRIRNVACLAQSVQVDIVNSGDHFLRSKEVEVQTVRGKKYTSGGFPMLPHSFRALRLPVGDEVPTKLTVKFNDFSIEEPIGPTAGGAP